MSCPLRAKSAALRGNGCDAWGTAHALPSTDIVLCSQSQCTTQVVSTARVSCDSLCQARSLTCSGIRTNGNCQGFCAWYQTSGTYQCSRDYACGTTPPATSTCGSTAASFVSALCGCSSP